MRVGTWAAVVVAGLLSTGCGAGDPSDADAPGSDTHPMTLTVGRPFSALGFDYGGGWAVEADDTGHADVVGLQLTNARADATYVFLTIRLVTGAEVAASIACTGPEGRLVARGATVTLECTSTDPLPASWDQVTIRDTY